MSLFIQELAEILSFSFIFTALASRILAVFFIALFFSSIGSFLNVCIYRVPLKLSIIKPDSYCPKCKTPIKPWHNIPIISYFLLRGRCYYCHERFSFRYCLVEIITAMLAIVFFIKNGWVLDLVFLKFIIFMCFGIMIILLICSRVNGLKTITSSMRFKNSGLKCIFSSCCTPFTRSS